MAFTKPAGSKARESQDSMELKRGTVQLQTSVYCGRRNITHDQFV
jgi:hypothetical protein